MLSFFLPWITSVIQYGINLVDYYFFWIIGILNYYVPGWKLVLLSPFVITFIILPTLVVCYLYLSALLLYVYRRRHKIYEGFHQHSVWEGYKKMIGTLWSGHGWIWHGYEVKGAENIPDKGGALIVYYHGAIPIDLYYLNANLYMEKNRTLCSIMDNFCFKIPGLSKFFQFWGCFPGPRDRVVELLKAGELVSVAPGGVREALFSENYSILWEGRQGFAKAALEAKMPIIPVFTENIREAFDYMQTGKRMFRKVYERTRWPLRPLYGGFPVKLTTHVGRPIYSDKNTTTSELVAATKRALELLIKRHQRRPGSIVLSFLQRFTCKSETELEIIPTPGSGECSDASSECDFAENLSNTSSSSADHHDEESLRTPFLTCQCTECGALRKMNLDWTSYDIKEENTSLRKNGASSSKKVSQLTINHHITSPAASQ